MEKTLAVLPNKKIVSFHSSWAYFFRDFNLENGGYLEPKPGISPSPKHLQELIDQMKQNHASLILKESFFSDHIPDFISEKTGARVVDAEVYSSDYIGMINAIVYKISEGK